jgi:hypothetical protein
VFTITPRRRFFSDYVMLIAGWTIIIASLLTDSLTLISPEASVSDGYFSIYSHSRFAIKLVDIAIVVITILWLAHSRLFDRGTRNPPNRHVPESGLDAPLLGGLSDYEVQILSRVLRVT